MGGISIIIRKTTTDDLDAVMDIYADALIYMREKGNPNQWNDNYPSRELITGDVFAGKSYVADDNGRIAAVFYFGIEHEPSYKKIKGQWLNDEPYGVVHRIAKNREFRGVAEFCLNWCFTKSVNMRIDTHRDNIPMRKLLDKLRFTYCGIIWLENGDERMAYQKVGT